MKITQHITRTADAARTLKRCISEFKEEYGAFTVDGSLSDARAIVEYFESLENMYAWHIEQEQAEDTVIRYDMMKSGGEEWLTKEQWQRLEECGWEIDWGSTLGGELPHYAIRRGLTMEEARDEFERVTYADVEEQSGCPCCGPPHQFEILEERY